MLTYLITRPAHRADQPYDEDLDEYVFEFDEAPNPEPDTYEVIMAEYKRLGIA